MSRIPPLSKGSDIVNIRDEEVEAALRPVRNRFCNLLTERILVLEACRKQAAIDADPLHVLERIAGIAHKISGVGAMLGFHRAGELAGSLEQTISAMRNTTAGYSGFHSKIDSQLEALLDELELLLDR